jgi:gliding motility associated protien GldN
MVVRTADGEDDSLDANNNPIYRKLAAEAYTSKDALQYALKEDWFFDKQRSVMDVRILGIGIFLDRETKIGGEAVRRVEEVGWIYFPQCRSLFARTEVYNPKNDSERRTYEDFFWKRMFSSYITKESNTFNRTVDTYAKGLDAMIESDRIKADLYKWEAEIWHY